jgi:hypothetical protein
MDCGIDVKSLEDEARLILSQKLLGCAYILVISCLLEIALASIILSQFKKTTEHLHVVVGMVFGAVFSQMAATFSLIRAARKIRNYMPLKPTVQSIKV